MSVVIGGFGGPKADHVRKDSLPRERLMLLRDGLIGALSERCDLTYDQIAVIFNRHPEHIGRIVRNAPEEQFERVYAILQGRI